MKCLHQTLARIVTPDDTDERRASAEVRNVVGGVACAARHDLGRVVLEDEHRRFARHPGDAARDELVGDEVAQYDDAAATRGGQQRQQTRPEIGP